MDSPRQAPITKNRPIDPDGRRLVLFLLILGAAMGVLREFLELAWTGGVEGIEGWVILHRAIRGAIGLSLGMVICLRLTRRWDSFLSGGMMGATVSQLGPISSALAWPALLSSGLIGLFAGSFCGLAGSVIPQFIPNVPAKAEVSSDPLDEEV